VNPPFCGYYLIDLDRKKVAALRKMAADRPNVHIFEGDCNSILQNEVFPNVRYENYRRGLCLLDPYGLHLNWRVIQAAGQMKSIDMFLNFPVADMNRNVLWRDPKGVDESDIARMNTYWGDESWRHVAYTTRKDLFGRLEKEDNETIARAFGSRLNQVAGFDHVPKPIPMRNSKRAIVYYLFFASQKPVAESIVKDIFGKYRTRGA
jgi:three-Cys-motif partner protein